MKDRLVEGQQHFSEHCTGALGVCLKIASTYPTMYLVGGI
jgi:hypothetical protein